MLLALLLSACGSSDRPPPAVEPVAVHDDSPAPVHGEAPPAEEAPQPGAECPGAIGGIAIESDRLGYEGQIGFDLYAPALAPDAAPILADVGRAIAGCPTLEIEVRVHTDTRRMTSFNARQSQAIAEQIVASLVEAGAARERLVACGRGEAGPQLEGLEGWDPSQNRVVFARLDHPAASHTCAPAE